MRRPESSTTILRLQGLGVGFRACHESKMCGVAQSQSRVAATAVLGERSLLQKGLGRERDRERERESGKGCFGSCCCLHGYTRLGLFQGLCGMG